MIKKQEQAVLLYERGDKRAALKMAKTFRIGISAEDSKQLIRGFECYENGRFYKMLGFKPEDEIRKACEIFEKCFCTNKKEQISCT